MDEDVLNMSMRKFLKKVGVTSQREIEQAIRDAIAAGKLDGTGSVEAQVRLTAPSAGLDVVIDGKIELE